tara:strand:- start:9087 stop:10064 length:978 start_codon:yes stop_codon:yes gene_type:complete
MQNINKKVLITGASGFIGRHLTKLLLDKGYYVVACGRQKTTRPGVKHDDLKQPRLKHPNLEYRKTNYGGIKLLKELLSGVDIVIHLAAKVHQMGKACDVVYQHENTLLTQNLAQAAAEKGVQHFIFLSTIKVNGENTTNKAFDEQTPERPRGAYGRSKWLAEQQLKKIAVAHNMAWTIIRPPLVYGPRVQANFRRLLKLVDSHLPLPFKGIRNQRSMIAVDNLVDFIVHCLVAPQAQNQLFCVADPDSVSTSDLVQYLQTIRLGRSWLLPCPQKLLRALAKLLGKVRAVDRLTESLVIDSQKAQQLLDWKPKVNFREAAKLYFSR